jgi:hypothetical protein
LSKVVYLESDPSDVAVERMRRLGRRLVGLESTVTRGHVELFERASFTRRVSRDGTGDGSSSQEGLEEGVAVRVRHADRSVGFAAESGDGDRKLDGLVRAALSSRSGSGEWPASGPPSRIDHATDDPLPSLDRLEAWLADALAGTDALEAWVEAGQTMETWVGPGGAAASRLRSRVWGMARFHHAGRERVEIVAATGLGGLDTRTWESTASDPPISGKVDRIDPRRPILVRPGAAATLVRALAEALHGRSSEPGVAVGPGWRLTDEPTAPDALFGGEFDDAGFPTRPIVLADGHRVRCKIDGPGTLRRPSFRDPPTPMSAWLRVRPAEVDPPADGAVVSDLVVEPLASDMVLRVHGWTVRHGRPDTAIRGALVPFDPRTWVQRCLGTHGAARASHHGVVTPALVFGDAGQV